MPICAALIAGLLSVSDPSAATSNNCVTFPVVGAPAAAYTFLTDQGNSVPTEQQGSNSTGAEEKAPPDDTQAQPDRPKQSTDEKKPPTPPHTGFHALFYG